MNIVMPTFEIIEWMPPTITLINELVRLGHTVTYITIYPDDYYKNFDQNNVKNIFLCNKNIELVKYGKNVRLISGILARIDILIKKIISHRVKKILKRTLKEEDILWVVNELTVMYAGSSFLKKYKGRYIFTIYELHTPDIGSRNIKKTAQNALINVVPEYNRAHIQKCYFKLSHLPLILPNKPIEHPLKRFIEIDDKVIKDKISAIRKKGKKILLYMGKITEERPLENLIEAVKTLEDEFELVIIGGESRYLNKLKDKYPNGFTYFDFVQPPNHLKIASWADIGVVVYVGDNNPSGLNALYCAPNKIYEYTGFGMPIIANNIPGLHYNIQTSKCGYCVDLDNPENIASALKKCMSDYEELSKNALDFFNSIDVGSMIENILNCYKERIDFIDYN